MDDREFEALLRARLHARFDRAEPSAALRERVADTMRGDARPVGWNLVRALFAAAAVVVIVVVLAINGSLGPQTVPGGTPTPHPSVSPTASPSPSPGPTLPLPSGSMPPISSAPWSGLRLTPLVGGPVQVSSVVAWSGGYLAIGQPSDKVSLPAWLSRDGRSWVGLPAETFGPASQVEAAGGPNGLIVVLVDANGQVTVRYSSDGLTWSTAGSPPIATTGHGAMGGNATGFVACLQDPRYALAFSTNGSAWAPIALPGTNAESCRAVTSFGDTFVAVGYLGSIAASTPATPAAWWSTDGRHWTRATVQAQPGDGFVAVQSGSAGLVASSLQPGYTPGTAHFWTSPNGRSWKVSTADPLGVASQGEGIGSANGTFVGDGTRVLGYGPRASGQPTEYWVSLDGTHWAKLALAGDTAAAAAGQATPFLLRDGILFSGDQGSWFGTETK